MNEVYVHTKTAHKEQPVIRLWHMEEKFGGLTVRKKGCARTQHGVPTDHLADMDGLNIRRRQPRPWYTGAEDKLIAAYRRHMEQLTVLGDQIKAKLPKYPTCVVTMRMDLKTRLRSAERTDVSTMRKLMPIGG
jgi:hypothetical protein